MISRKPCKTVATCYVLELSYNVFCMKVIGRTPKRKNSRGTQGCAQSRTRRNEILIPLWIKFGRLVEIPNIITCANVGDDRLRSFRKAVTNFSLRFHPFGGHVVFVPFFRLGHVPILATFDIFFSSLNITGNS